ncbi:hypothetical protein J1N35_040651 [Gossypium stocksii]|uniref:Uncharacterized protein n=1 Tax=Gossypium stocksii TaxID=47602 RepID=A0A9D3ZIP9_9ROSI|nr:hypothetical protein J1N35_040651 [Gossypium stocksii]
MFEVENELEWHQRVLRYQHLGIAIPPTVWKIGDTLQWYHDIHFRYHDIHPSKKTPRLDRARDITISTLGITIFTFLDIVTPTLSVGHNWTKKVVFVHPVHQSSKNRVGVNLATKIHKLLA